MRCFEKTKHNKKALYRICSIQLTVAQILRNTHSEVTTSRYSINKQSGRERGQYDLFYFFFTLHTTQTVTCVTKVSVSNHASLEVIKCLTPMWPSKKHVSYTWMTLQTVGYFRIFCSWHHTIRNGTQVMWHLIPLLKSILIKLLKAVWPDLSLQH